MTASRTTLPASAPARSERLPWPALLVLAVACFGAVLVENLPAGMLPAISHDLGVTVPQAGALVGVFALTSAATALPLVALARSLPRRRLLLTMLAGFVAADALTAAAPTYPVALVSRVLAGVATGVMWSMLAGYAAALVPGARAGAAVAVVLGGSTVALSFGLPAGTVVGGLAGWRTTFWLLAALGVVLVVATRLLVPEVLAAGGRTSARALLRRPGMAAVAVASLLVGAGHNALYTYIAPFLDLALGRSGVPGGIAAALLVFGVTSVVGNAVAARWLDRSLRTVALAATAGLALVLLALALVAGHPVAALVAVAVWGLVFGMVPATFQTAALRVSGENSEVAVAVAITTYNVGIAAGSAAAGVALGAAGVGAVPWLALAVTLPGLAVVAAARRAGFPR